MNNNSIQFDNFSNLSPVSQLQSYLEMSPGPPFRDQATVEPPWNFCPVPTSSPREPYLNRPIMALEHVPFDSPEEHDDFDEKYVAHKRFQRNNILVNRVMSSEVVSSGVPVSEKKLKVMRQQVKALEMCLEKEKAEVALLEQKNAAVLEDFRIKKEAFDKTYKKISRPITDAQIAKFTTYIYERVQARRLERLELQRQQEETEDFSRS